VRDPVPLALGIALWSLLGGAELSLLRDLLGIAFWALLGGTELSLLGDALADGRVMLGLEKSDGMGNCAVGFS